MKKFDEYMRDIGMFSGISRPFHDLLNVRKAYSQSIKAIEAGKHLGDDKVLFFYEDYILQHILNLCSGQESLKEFCHPSIFIPMDYDRDNGTNYLSSLYSYTMKFISPSELASEMHIHRNTLYYRIGKLEEK